MPITLYHGTSAINIPSIKKHGLTLGNEPNHYETHSPEPIPNRFFNYGVFLTEHLNTAITYANDSTYGNRLEIAVVEIELPDDFTLGDDGFGELMSNNEPIPPTFIKKIWKYDDLEKEFGFLLENAF